MGVDASDLRALAREFDTSYGKKKMLMSAVVNKSAADVRGRAMANAPVDTGYLRSSIVSENVGDLEAEIGPTANYGGYVEEGTSRMSAQPYMSPALDAVAPAFAQAVAQAAGGAL